jgi:hypothetical protein
MMENGKAIKGKAPRAYLQRNFDNYCYDRHGRGVLMLSGGFKYDGCWANNYAVKQCIRSSSFIIFEHVIYL